MPESVIKSIIGTCRRIDELAYTAYTGFAEAERADADLADFWRRMADTEAGHVAFWERAGQLEGLASLYRLFDDPERVRADLERILARGREQAADFTYSVADAFLLAYRLEFLLLHPAFDVLFSVLGSDTETNPGEAYNKHVNAFVDGLARYGTVTPALELLGETLSRLWRDNRQLARLSTHDHLTGVLNRRGFFSFAQQVAHLAQRTGQQVTMLMVDIDFFKKINDDYGHAAGDRVLRHVARVLTGTVRASDVVGRYGGEEFVVFLPGMDSRAACTVAENVRRAVAETRLEEMHVTVSIGVAAGVPGVNVLAGFNSLLYEADKAMYRAKGEGRNRVVCAEGTPDAADGQSRDDTDAG